MVLHAFYNLIDAFWLGKLGRQALAAPGVCMPVFFFVIAFGMGLGHAATAMVAQHAGAGRHRKADHAAAQVLLLLCAFAGVLAVPMMIAAPRLLTLARVPRDVVGPATTYLRVLMPGLPLIAFTIGYAAVLRALGDTITALLVGAAANVLNVVLDPLLIFGWAGVPAMGVGGAALATLISQLVAALACCVLVRRRHLGLRILPADLKPDWPVIRKAVAIGIPMAVSNSSNSLGFAVFQVMINTLGTAVVGAFTLGFRVIHLFSVPGQAMAMAAAPVVGQALGAGKPRLARRAVLLSAALVGGMMVTPLAFLIWQGQLVARLFVTDPEVVTEARMFFLVVPASSYFFGVLMVLGAAFLGSGHTRPVMMISIVRTWVLRLPLAYVLYKYLELGAIGIYLGMVGSNILAALLAFWLFWAGGWQSAVVSAAAVEPEGPAAAGSG